MKNKNVIVFICFVLAICNIAFAQEPDKVYQSNIGTVQFFPFGDQTQLPIYNLGSETKFQLNFDDLDGGYKNYYYTYQLCDYDWKPNEILQSFDFIKGFTQNRITTYRYSTIALTKYTHYQVTLPDRGSYPSRSGNYLVKVFLDGDTSKLVFTKRLLVVDKKSSINALVQQSLGVDNSFTHQKVRFTATLGDINAFSASQQVKAVVLQNNNWASTQKDIKPTFVRGNVLDYSNNNIAVFPAGKEWRWLDVRSFRVQSDRVDHADYGKTYTDLFLRTDADRANQRYNYYADYNGAYNIVTYESINPFWQGDYAKVYFSFAPPNGKPFLEKDLYIAGQFTNYEVDNKYKLTYNSATGMYEGNVYLKQGFYTYTYLLKDENGFDFRNTLEGNYWEAENNYTILLYYKGFTDRADLLIGVEQLNSRRERQGLGF